MSLYLHIPFCDGKCGYCAFYSVRYDAGLADRLLAALEKELILSREAGIAPAAETVYSGGGTPSILSESQLERLCAMIRAQVPAPPPEWTVEMNPGSVTASKLRIMVQAGVNRISLGAQAFDDRVLAAFGRRHSVADIVEAVTQVRRAGVENFGLDLIAGVPGFAAAVWREALDRAVALAPRHVSVYALTDEEGTRLNGAVARGETALLTDEEQLAALAAAEKVLTAAGYRRYEISNYAKPGFECRHHCACWRGGEYLGLGPAAASHVGLERWTNRPDLAAYLAALEQGRLPPRELDHLTPALKAMERVVFGLRMAEGISAAVAADYVPALRELRKKGLVTFRRRRWSLTARGRELADAVAVELMEFISGRNPEIN
jgi:oxygen-independent coproporphyrinogen-3 oxidase